MLHQLRSRLHTANFAVHFAIVTAEPSDDDTMVELSRVSAGIPIVSFDTLPEAFAARSGWNRYSNDIMVIDSCGRLTYQVVMPWSSLQYPYVKAAVISTLIDQPCGPCDGEKNPKLTKSHVHNTTQHETQEGRNKTQLKLTSIVNMYKPQHENKETAEGNEHLTDVEENIRDADIVGKTSENVTNVNVVEDEKAQFTIITNITEENSQPNEGDTHGTLHKDTVTTEKPEKVYEGKKKLLNKKHQSKQKAKHTKHDEISEEPPQNLPNSNLELAKSGYSSAENDISSEVTLAPLRETKDGLIPIRVIMRSPHEHDGKKYDFLEMQLGNPGYHGHLGENEQESELDLEKERKELQLIEDDLDHIGVQEKEDQKKDPLISGYEDREESGLVEKKVENENIGSIWEHTGDSVIDAVKVEQTTSKSESTDKNVEAKRKNKKTEKEDKKVKGKKTKLSNIPEQEWMKEEIKDLPDTFDDICPQVNDFANDVREEESNHKNEENVLDDLTVTDLKYLIEEMGLEVNGTKEAVKNDSIIFSSTDNKNQTNKGSKDDVVKKFEVPLNATVEVTNDKKVHHNSSKNSISITEKPEKAKELNLKGKDTVTKGKDSDETVNRTKVKLAPTLSESNGESTSGSEGSSKEVMEHYSKLLRWIDYRL